MVRPAQTARRSSVVGRRSESNQGWQVDRRRVPGYARRQPAALQSTSRVQTGHPFPRAGSKLDADTHGRRETSQQKLFCVLDAPRLCRTFQISTHRANPRPTTSIHAYRLHTIARRVTERIRKHSSRQFHMNSTRPTAARATSGPLRTQRTPLDRRGRNMTHRSPATGNFSFASHPRGHARRTTDRRDPPQVCVMC